MEIFADQIENITLENGVIRIDFVSISPRRGEQNQTLLEFRQRVVMPVEGFVRSFALMNELFQKLKDAGVITVKSTQEQTQPGPV